MNWKLWLEGLGAAALGGAATGATQMLSGTGQFNQGTAIAAAVGALFGVVTYLKVPATLSTIPNVPQVPVDPNKP